MIRAVTPAGNAVIIEHASELPDPPASIARLYADCETRAPTPDGEGLSPYEGARTCGWAVTWDDCPTAFYIPIRHADARWNLPVESVVAWLQTLLRRSTSWVNHNIKFDAHFALSDGIELPESLRLVCTLTRAKMIDSDRMGHGLKEISRDWLGLPPDERDEVAAYLKAVRLHRNRRCHDFSQVPADVLGRYACGDVLRNRVLDRWLKDRREPEQVQLWETETKLTSVLLDMEVEGLRVDKRANLVEKLRCVRAMVDACERVRDLTTVELVDSNECFHELLINQLGLPILGYTEPSERHPGGQPSFEADVMVLYAGHPRVLTDERATEIVKLALRYRTESRFLSLYVESFEKFLDPRGYIHPSYNQLIRTGRMSSSRPNGQQQNERSKALIIPAEGEAFLCSDACIPAHVEVITAYGNKSMREVVERKLPVLGYDQAAPENRRLKFCNISAAAFIRNDDVYRVRLSSGRFIECTAEHGFVQIDGSRINCRDLQPGTRLKHVGENRWNGRPQWRVDAQNVAKHILSGEWRHGWKVYHHYHHKDEDPENWSADNIELKHVFSHLSDHAKAQYLKQDHAYRVQKLREAKQGAHVGSNNPNYKGGKIECFCEVCAEPLGERFPSQARHRCKEHDLRRRRGPAHPRWKEGSQAYYCEVCSVLLGSARTRCRKHRIIKGVDRFAHLVNHRVVSVEYVGIMPVYSLTNPTTHNYVTAEGLVNLNSQIEFRVMCHYIQDERALKAYAEDPTTDFHAWVAKLCGVERSPAKSLNFAMGYGAGRRKVTAMLMSNEALVRETERLLDSPELAGTALKAMPRADAVEQMVALRASTLYETYHATIPGLRVTSERAAILCRSRGYIKNAYGRRRHLPPKAAHKAFNTLNQGCAMDFIKERMVALSPRFNEHSRALGLRLNANVHDEILMSVPASFASTEYVDQTLSTPSVPFRVPLRWNTGRSERNWAEAKA